MKKNLPKIQEKLNHADDLFSYVTDDTSIVVYLFTKRLIKTDKEIIQN